MILLSYIFMFILILEVILVAYQNDGEFLIGIILGLIEPLGQIIEGGAIGDVIHENCSD